MIYKDRDDAARELLKILKKDSLVKRGGDNLVIVSLLRGGIIVGKLLANKLGAGHLPLVVAKIPAPFQEELAIGALCFDTVYLEKRIIESLNLSRSQISRQIEVARTKFDSYLKHFGIEENLYKKVKNKIAILVDDGVATGATARAGALFLKEQGAKYVVLAVPVAPVDFDPAGFDRFIAVHKDPSFGSVSQFYQDFPQVEDEEVKKLI